MKTIVTHSSPDLDGITAIWLIKRFLPGWENASYAFVPAGDQLNGSYEGEEDGIETIDGNEVIHVDTGLGKFDHHNTADTNISAASLVFDFVSSCEPLSKQEVKKEALKRIVSFVVDTDHFQEIFYDQPLAVYHDFSLLNILEGLKLQYPNDNEKYVEFGIGCLDAILHSFENRIWAENEIREKGIEFETKWGKGLAVETVNDNILKLGQKMGYVIVIKRDPNHGFIRIKAIPTPKDKQKAESLKIPDIDLTPVYKELKKLDPDATWFLHISKKMLLNGSAKNPKMKATKLDLQEIIDILKRV